MPFKVISVTTHICLDYTNIWAGLFVLKLISLEFIAVKSIIIISLTEISHIRFVTDGIRFFFSQFYKLSIVGVSSFRSLGLGIFKVKVRFYFNSSSVANRIYADYAN